MKISKNLSAKYYQENNERPQEKARGREGKVKKQQYCRELTKVFQKMKKINWLSTEKNIIK